MRAFLWRGRCMMVMRMKMKVLRYLLPVLPVLAVVLPLPALAEEKAEKGKGPTVEVYEIRKLGEGRVHFPQVILEIANPTERTFYFRAESISSPSEDLEVKRGEKWVVGTLPSCPVGDETYALRPGAKMLVSVNPTWTEEACRFRYFFCTGKDMSGEVVTARTRAIKPEELGERGNAHEACEKKQVLEEVMTDEDLTKRMVWEREEMKRFEEEEARRAAEEAKKK